MNHLFRVLLIFSIFFTGCEENFPYEDLLDLSGEVSKELPEGEEELPEGEDLNGYEAVDLDLPSGIKWATHNIGATRPGDNGKRYAWGEIKEKDYYNWDIYKWAKGSSTTLTKYCTDSSNGTVDGKKALDLEDDVAHATWGGSWRMPTAAEFEELRNECSWYWTSENGNNGYRVTSRTNGNSIFLPAGRYSYSSPMYGDYDYYWSSSIGSSDSDARCLYIYKSSASITNASRYINYPIRPVSGDRIKFSVSVNSAGNGTVAIKGDSLTSAAFKEASAVTVTATPDSGFEFKGWFVGDADAPVSADAEYTFTVYGDVTLVAKFVKPAVVSVSSTGNGTVVIKDCADATVTFYTDDLVTVVATPNEGYTFSGWFVGDAGAPVSTATEYSFNVKEDIDLIAKFKVLIYEAVDLGLPSGIKWATFNVGATKPEECGNYYAWGEINTKESYTEGNSLTYDRSSYNINISGDIRYDAACYLWKGTWRMPTAAEFEELVNNCAWELTEVNGVNGYKVTSTVNGNSIFLPAAGYKNGTSAYSASYAYYWSDSYYPSSSSYYSYNLYFSSGYYTVSYKYRYYGMPIRPVCE